MADTVEIFVGGLPLAQLRERIRQCTGLTSEMDQYGNINYLHADFLPSLATNDYVEGDEVDTSAYEYELTAKNYWEPETGGEHDSPTVAWFQDLFSRLSSYNDSQLLLTYNHDYVLARFDPVTD